MKVFYHKSNSGSTLFASDDEALSSYTTNKYSILHALEGYRNANGQFEFLLEYPGVTGYNRWKQTSNPTVTSEAVTGYEAISITWTEQSWGGLCKSSSADTFVDGSVGSGSWYYAIGAHVAWNSGIPAGFGSTAVEEVCLWVRIDNWENTNSV